MPGDRSTKSRGGHEKQSQFVQKDEHRISVEELSVRLGTDLEKGLTTVSVHTNLEAYGSNEIVSVSINKSACHRFMKHSLQGISSVMLAGATVCYMAFIAELLLNVSEAADLENLYVGTTLLLFIFVTGIYSYFKERKALSLLKKVLTLVSHDTTVIRNGERKRLNSKDVVVGDLVELKYGDTVPADIRVISAAELKVDDSTLSGNVEPKTIQTECTDNNRLVTSNLIFASTFIVEGTCRGIVINVGLRTLAGQIADLTSYRKEKPTKLSIEITKLVLIFTCIGLVLALTFWVTAISYNMKWADASIYLVATCVAVCPESLLSAINCQVPNDVSGTLRGQAVQLLECMVSHTLAGSRMMKRNCLAKHFDAIENLGTSSIVCVDKTGTLTENQMAVSHIWTCGQTIRNVFQDKISGEHESLKALFRCMVLTSRSVFKTRHGDRDLVIPETDVIGREPGDIAILRCAGHNFHNAVELSNKNRRIHDVPYNYRDFFQLSIHIAPGDTSIDPTQKCRVVIKGAPEIVFRLCSTVLAKGIEEHIAHRQEEFENILSKLGSMEERVVGFCDKVLDIPPGSVFEGTNYPRSGFRFLGLVSMTDPPGATVSDSIAKLRKADVKVIMLTGDHPSTAISFARSVGIFSQGVETANTIAERQGIRISNLKKEEKTAIVLTGDVLNKMSKDSLDKVIREFSDIVCARVSPIHKLYIVESCQRIGSVVTMVGDGINDVYALKAADISIAMGLRSSEAAKNVSDIVLLDNNFSSIIAGIEEGRLIFDNIRKSTAFALSSNLPEVLPFLLLLVLKIPTPLNPMGILLISIGADLFPSIALAYEKPESDFLMKGRNTQREELFTGSLIARAYLRIGIIQSLAGLFAYLLVMAENGFRFSELIWQSRLWYSHRTYKDSRNQEWTFHQREELEHAAQTAYFFAVVLCQLANAICCKNRRNSIFKHGLNSNWRLNVALSCQLVIGTAIAITQFHHFIEHSRAIRWIDWRWLLPGIPFAIFIFIYDEARKLVSRKWPNSWISRVLYF